MSLDRKTPLKRTGGPKRKTEMKRKPTKRKRRPPGVGCTALTLNGKSCRQNRMEGYTTCPTHTADALCADWIFRRDKSTCRRCHRPGKRGLHDLHWAHLYSRRYKLVRWNPLNSMALCAGCHFWQTNNPLEGEEFFVDQIGDTAWLGLRKLALGDEKPNPAKWIEFYTEKP